MPPDDAMHQNTAPNTTTMRNKKYVSADGYFKAVYSYNGKLLNEGMADIDMGTYNYAPSTKKHLKWGSIQAKGTHGIKDVLPYLIYKNTKNDLQKMYLLYKENFHKQVTDNEKF